jgi:ribonuclease P protein component
MAGIARLRRRTDFVRVAGSRRRCATPGFILQALVQPEVGGPLRVGFTASRKVGMAVERNRARRRLREAVRRVMPLHAAMGHDYVLVARAETIRRPFAALIGDLEAALKQLGAWRATS